MIPHLIELTEYSPTILRQWDEATAVALRQAFGDKITVEFPSPVNEHTYRLTAQGWAGYLALSPETHLSLKPKVAWVNLFGLMAYAYGWPASFWQEGQVSVTSWPLFYEWLAERLVQLVRRRIQQGLYQAYVPQTTPLPYIRGRLNGSSLIHHPTQSTVLCTYEPFTAVHLDNQIIAHTLRQIALTGLCRPDTQTAVRQTYRILQPLDTHPHITVAHCTNRPYHRLNQDYQPIHALCRFFLEYSHPGWQKGTAATPAFLINMADLYERFVAQWLQRHLPSGWHLNAQEHVALSSRGEYHLQIDLVLYAPNGRPHAVLDTKYKTPAKPDNADIYQIATYATAKQCQRAYLIYPAPLPRPLDLHLDTIHLQSLTFAIEGDLDRAGQQFLQTLFASL